MRIEFAHAVHPPLSWSGAPLRIGSAADNDVSLPGRGVAGHHAILSHDARGLVLEVCEGAGRVYVNARPVREKALLRCGDSLGIGECRLHLVADAVPDPGDAGPSMDATAVMALRIVAGPLSGRVYALDETLALDDHGPMPASRGKKSGLILEPCGQQVRLDAGGLSSSRTVSVNGRDVRQALLGDGDQVVTGALRFVLDISADTPLPPAPAEVEPASDDDTASRRDTRHPEIWWLIVTAAVLALVLAAALFVHF
ncbi:MAG TPA: FHA domain-containing protein [Oleiagrimonas sp.]|nr:FHA domain-containing protein [Oleiagrimonas sp.]